MSIQGGGGGGGGGGAAAAAAAAARQQCVTVVKNRAGTFFEQVFAIRKVPKVCNCL